MRTVHELNQNELEELREAYFQQLTETDSEVLGDISSANEIPMENIISHYEEIYFVEEDFFCNLS
jgi:sulfur relay (sulfurtransferase) DsrC/TusE family protein